MSCIYLTRSILPIFEQNVLCIFDLTWIMNVKVRCINNFQFVHPNKILTIYRFWQCLKKNIGHQKSKQSFTFDFLWATTENSHGTYKGQMKSEWIYEGIDFPNYQRKNLKDLCPESLFEVWLKVSVNDFEYTWQM